MRKLVSAGVVLSFLASWSALPALAEKNNGAGASLEAGGKLAIFDSSHRSLEKWHDTWQDGSSTGAKLVVEGNVASAKGTQSDRNYGVVYQYVDWDLDKYPFLEVEVLSCDTEWYLVIENKNLETGFIKIEEGTRQIGKRAYNIRKACGLHGLRHIRLDIGISTNERPANLGLSAQFYSIRLVSHTEAKIIPPPAMFTGSEAEVRETASLGWDGRWENGGSSGAALFKSTDKTLKLVGTSPDQCYGCVHKDVTVDFAEYPNLEVGVRNSTAQMYIVFEGPQFHGGYYRLSPAMTKPGQYVFNFTRDLAYLKGPQSFAVKLGITTDNPQIPCKGQKAEFSSVKLVSKGGIELLAGVVSSQLISPPPPLVAPQPLANRPLDAEYKKKIETVDKGGLFSQFAEVFNPKPQTIKTADPVFSETADRLTVANASYEAVFNRQNGTVISLTDKLHNSQVSLGSEQPFLWRLMYKNEDYLNAEEFLAGAGARFSYTWDNGNTLHLNYARGASLVQVNVEFSKLNYFDLSAVFKNGEDKVITALDLPKLCFDFRKLDHFYFPWGVGVAFNSKFFKDKRQMKATYPGLFSDFNAWSLRDGGELAVYLNWVRRPVMPTRINVGYSPAKGESGAWEHGWTTYIQPKQSWNSQPVRFLFGEQIEAAIRKYKKDVNLTSSPLAVDKMGRALFNKVTNGVLLKVALDLNRDFDYLKHYYDDLPRDTIIHFVSWWLEGFDHHMPDYWPVDPTFGTDADFKESIRLAHAKGMVVMPYTNPTFWNPSPTLKHAGGPEVVASRDLKNQVIFETYPSGGTGWAVSPRQPEVKRSMEQVAEKVFQEYGVDMQFLDQIGARFVTYDLNPTLGNPLDYSEAWLENCRENTKRGPLYTEQGYDRLIPVMSGFCGLLSFSFPESKDYNSWWGEKTWEYFPLAQYLAHEHVLFYHHNLAHDVFADTEKKISFYLMQGYNLYTARWISSWASQKKWFYIADRLQKAVASKYDGKPLLNFAQPESQRLYWSAYPDLGILANISDNFEKNILNHTIARNGFMAANRSGSFVAGLFTRLYGFSLAKEQYLIIDSSDKKITVQQLQPQNSLLTVPRPAAWKLAEAIQVEQGSSRVQLVATTPQTITFYTDGSLSGPATYTLEYNTGFHPNCSVNLFVSNSTASANTGIKVGIEAVNLTSSRMENIRLVLSAWLVKRNLPVIDPKAGYLTLSPDQNFKTKPGVLTPGGYLSAEFPLEIPPTAAAGDMVWLKGELVMPGPQGQSIVVSQSVIPVVSPFEITIQPAREKLTADSKTSVDVTVKNNFSAQVKGELELDLPDGWEGSNRRNITVAPGASLKTVFVVTTPPLEDKKTFELGAAFRVDKNVTATQPVKVDVVPMWKIISLEGMRMLVPGQKSKCVLRLAAQPEKFASGTVILSPSSGLKLDRREMSFNVPEGGTQYLEFYATATGNSDQSLTVEVRSQEGNKSFTAEYPVVAKDEARVVSGDLFNRGDHDLILGNSGVEVQALRELGGRILSFYCRNSGANMLYQNYPNIPKISGDENWAEYGGINDWFPEGWPGYVWNDFWFAQVTQERGGEASVRMTTQTKNGLKIEKILTLPASGRRLKVEYRIKNLADVPRKYLWSLHPDLCPGPERYAGEHDRMVIPVADPKNPGKTQILTNKFIGKIGKDSYKPSLGWALGLNQVSKDYFLETFDLTRVKEIGVWQDANFFTLELLGKEESLAPGESRGFSVVYVVGNNDWREELK